MVDDREVITKEEIKEVEAISLDHEERVRAAITKGVKEKETVMKVIDLDETMMISGVVDITETEAMTMIIGVIPKGDIAQEEIRIKITIEMAIRLTDIQGKTMMKTKGLEDPEEILISN